MTSTETRQRPRVLIVDDEESILEILEAVLTNEENYEVIKAHNGVEGLKHAQESTPDLIITDVVMPEKDGFELCKTIKDTDETSFVPVVLLTGFHQRDYRLKGLESGADDFLSKPFDLTELRTRVKSLLRVKKLHDEVETKNAWLKEILTSYVSDEVSETILQDPDKHLRLGGETRRVTMLFADLRGFTTFSENHQATEVVEALNRFFSEMVSIIFEHKGTLDKFMGDCLMAFYGAPVSYEDDAARAVRTAIDMQRRFRDFSKGFFENAIDEPGLGIGLNTGDVVAGNVGSRKYMDYTVVGHAVNVAKRLEENSTNGQILITSSTRSTLGDEFRTEPVDITDSMHGRFPEQIYSVIQDTP